jgi:hypothetical protein
MWFGYMFVNHKDIPFATFLLASAYYCLLILTTDHPSWGLLVKAGLAVGLLTSTKAAGVPALPIIVGTVVVCLRYVPRRDRLNLPDNLLRRIWLIVAAGVAGSLFCFLWFWPQLYTFDLTELRSFLKLTKHSGNVGRYAVTYFVITTPLYLLMLALIGIGCAVYNRAPAIISAILVFAWAFLWAWWLDIPVYNGSRHFLFVYPFFMLVAAYPVSLLMDSAARVARLALVGGVGLCITITTFQMYRLFPYQYSFYNALVGGIRGAEGTYHIDTWRTAQREALEQIASKGQPGSALRIFTCGPSMDFKMRPEFQRSEVLEESDYIVSLRRGCPPEQFEGLPVVGEVRRDGVLLSRIYTPR